MCVRVCVCVRVFLANSCVSAHGVLSARGGGGGGGGGGDGGRFVGRNFHELPRLSDGPCSRLY